jgi:hypothetical protein
MSHPFRLKLAASSLIALILLAACGTTTFGGGGNIPLPDLSPGDAATPPPPTVEESAPADASPEGSEIAELPAAGSLAVTGADRNMYVLRAGQAPVMLTDDALPIDPETLSGHIYLHPTWSRSGWLSYVGVELLGGSPIENDVIVHAPGSADPISLYSSGEETFIYGYWAPQACADSGGCERYAYLMNNDDGIGLRLAEIDPEEGSIVSDDEIARAAPFYYSWAPDGASMLWHQQAMTISRYDVSADRAVHLQDEPTGRFLAPHWSPAGDRLLYATLTDDQLSQILLVDGDTTTPLGDPLPGAVFFNWSPDGNLIAYNYGVDPLSAVTVIDPDGETVARFEDIPLTTAFFWAPDSSKLAIISVEAVQDTADQPDLSARARRAAQPQPQETEDFVFGLWVANVETGETQELARFLPTPEQWTLYRYFDQYGQSHRQWSPDSRYFVYAEHTQEGAPPLIRLADSTGQDEPPLVLMQGSLAIFSFDE